MPYPMPTYPQPPIWGGTIAALVLSISCFFCLGPLGSVPGLVLGIVGLSKCRRDPDLYGGKGMALAAVIIGSVGTLFGLVYLVILLIAMIAG